jgi:membrane-associated phospholipid phosphatase
MVDNQTDVILNFLKDVINRPRPYQLAKAYDLPLYPLIRTNAMTAAYPSGHSLTAFVMADHYSNKYPEISEDLQELGKRIADSREVTGIHYPSDTKISRMIADIIAENNLIK